MASDTPGAGEIVFLDFDPQAGKEITKRRPALVLSPKEFNQKMGFVWVCPITSTPSKHAFQLELPDKLKTRGVVKIEQLRSLDFTARNAKVIERVPASFLTQCRTIASRVLGF